MSKRYDSITVSDIRIIKKSGDSVYYPAGYCPVTISGEKVTEWQQFSNIIGPPVVRVQNLLYSSNISKEYDPDIYGSSGNIHREMVISTTSTSVASGNVIQTELSGDELKLRPGIASWDGNLLKIGNAGKYRIKMRWRGIIADEGIDYSMSTTPTPVSLKLTKNGSTVLATRKIIKECTDM